MSPNFTQRQSALGRLRAENLQARATKVLQDFHNTHLDTIDTALTGEYIEAVERLIHIDPRYAQVLELLAPPDQRGPSPPPSIWYGTNPAPSLTYHESDASLSSGSPDKELKNLEWVPAPSVEREAFFHDGRGILKVTNPDADEIVPAFEYIRDVSNGKIKLGQEFVVEEMRASKDREYREALRKKVESKSGKQQQRSQPQKDTRILARGRAIFKMRLSSLLQLLSDVAGPLSSE